MLGKILGHDSGFVNPPCGPEMPVMPDASVFAAHAHDQAHEESALDSAFLFGSSGPGAVRAIR